MEELKLLLIGIIQGLTEFLPISSSGHIELSKAFFNINFFNENGLLVTIVLHTATALSTLWVFRKDLFLLLKNIIQTNHNDSHSFFLKIIISIIPAALVGLVFEKQIKILFNSNIILTGSMLIITGLILYFSNKIKFDEKKVGYKHAFLIGLVQAFAILPGISRSGSTIVMALFLGISKKESSKFSFLMVIPLIFGALTKNFIQNKHLIDTEVSFSLAIGFMSAFITGVIACRWMIKLVERSKLQFFGIYCLIIGTIALLYGSI